MKLLLDTCVWGGAGAELTASGHDVVHAGDWDEDPGDEAILRFAFEASRVLVTLDKDFGELAVVRAMPHVGIIRLVEIPARQQGVLCHRVLERYQDELAARAIITATSARVRVRMGDDDAMGAG